MDEGTPNKGYMTFRKSKGPKVNPETIEDAQQTWDPYRSGWARFGDPDKGRWSDN